MTKHQDILSNVIDYKAIYGVAKIGSTQITDQCGPYFRNSIDCFIVDNVGQDMLMFSHTKKKKRFFKHILILFVFSF